MQLWDSIEYQNLSFGVQTSQINVTQQSLEMLISVSSLLKGSMFIVVRLKKVLIKHAAS